LQGTSEALSLTVNVSKTVAMALNAITKPLVAMYGKTVPMAKIVKFLGVLFDDDASSSPKFQS